MSKNISIKEGGTGRGFTARKLETALEGGGSCLWVPKDEVRRVSKSVNENGTYEAAAEGAYGYSDLHVNVKVLGSATGKKSDGNEYTVTVNGLGDLTETKVPSSIKVTTPPTFVGPYGDGAIIGFDGIEVTAYDAEGNSMGVVPFDELVFPVTVAKYDPEQPIDGYYAKSDLDIDAPDGIMCGHETIQYGQEDRNSDDTKRHVTVYRRESRMGANVFISYITNITLVSNKRAIEFQSIVAASTPGTYSEHIETVRWWADTGEITQEAIDDIPFTIYDSRKYTHNEKTVYYIVGGSTLFNIDVYEAGIMPVANDQGRYGLIPLIAWTMVYGDLTPVGGVHIPVQWPRPGDGRILADTFAIEVVDATQGANT